MSAKERLRLDLMCRVDRGEMTTAEAAVKAGLSRRQARRVRARYVAAGEEGLVHRSRGRPGNRARDPEVRRRCLELIGEQYADFGPTLIAEKLAERDGIGVDHETVRRWMKEAGLWQGRPGRKHRRRRKRRERFGEMLQIDGSHHPWFEERAGPCCLMVVIDDATGRRMARLAPGETVRGAMELLKAWIEAHGIPASLYADRKNTFFPIKESGDRNGGGAFVRACTELRIEIIPARSPQAKGRVERSNRVFQDRLVKDLRLAGIDTIDAANAFLETWMTGHSRRFEVQAADAGSAHRHAGETDLGAVFAWHRLRCVHADFTVRMDNRWYQLLPRDPMPRPGDDVTLRLRLDGTLEILDGRGPLGFETLAAPPPPAAPPPKTSRPRKRSKPAPDHPWRGPLKQRTS